MEIIRKVRCDVCTRSFRLDRHGRIPEHERKGLIYIAGELMTALFGWRQATRHSQAHTVGPATQARAMSRRHARMRARLGRDGTLKGRPFPPLFWWLSPRRRRKALRGVGYSGRIFLRTGELLR